MNHQGYQQLTTRKPPWNHYKTHHKISPYLTINHPGHQLMPQLPACLKAVGQTWQWKGTCARFFNGWCWKTMGESMADQRNIGLCMFILINQWLTENHWLILWFVPVCFGLGLINIDYGQNCCNNNVNWLRVVSWWLKLMAIMVQWLIHHDGVCICMLFHGFWHKTDVMYTYTQHYTH